MRRRARGGLHYGEVPSSRRRPDDTWGRGRPSPDATQRESPSTRASPSEIISGRFARASRSRPKDSADFAGAALSAQNS